MLPLPCRHAPLLRHSRYGSGSGAGGGGHGAVGSGRGRTDMRRIRVNTQTGVGGRSGSRRGVVCSHIKGEGYGQHRGSGCGRRCGVISSLTAHVQKEGRYLLGRGRDDPGRSRICTAALPTRDSEARWRTCIANETNERTRASTSRHYTQKRSKKKHRENFALNSKFRWAVDRPVGCEMVGWHGSGALWFSPSRRRIGAPFCAAGRLVKRVVRVRRRFRRVVSPAPPARF